jgi:hypothetical protein
MNTKDTPAGEQAYPDRKAVAAASSWRPSADTVVAGLLIWAAISAGLFGLKLLMENRPEFVGQPAFGPKAELIQDSPSVVTRKMSDDVSVIKPMQPEDSEINFDMNGRRDYRGLRTIMDMSGGFHAQFGFTNAFDEPIFVLFKCPHPRNGIADGSNLPVSGLKLQSSVGGVQENGADAWLWSGTLAPQSGANIEIFYQVASIRGVTYRVGEQNGNPVKAVHVVFRRQDLDPMRFESGDGIKTTMAETVSWERREFLAPDFYSGVIVESRNLYQSLSQLLEIGPGICLLFLLAVSAVILARQAMNAVQLVTIATGYALYFPLVLYLSAHLSFPLAVLIAVIVPGALLLNYARWLLGVRLGLLGGVFFLGLYWVFPTLAAFAGWNRGMVLLCLGVVTLYVLIDLQNQALKRKVAIASLLMLLAWPCGSNAGDVQVILPGELVAKAAATKSEITPARIAFTLAQYQVRQETNCFHVEAVAAFQILRAGDPVLVMTGGAVYLVESHIESTETNLAWVVSSTNGLLLAAEHTGPGTMRLVYRVPIENREGNRRAEIPMLAGVSGNVRLESPRSDIAILTGSLWGRNVTDKATAYDIGVTGMEKLALEWREQGKDVLASAAKPAVVSAETSVQTLKPEEAAKDFYGIGLKGAQHLTIINTDGSCTHFAEFEVPASQGGEFRMKLPAHASLITASVNGNEIQVPVVEDQICRVKLPSREARQAVDHVSFRIAYPAMKLGFMGSADLALPEVFQTTGTTEWVVALPAGFETQVIASGLETQKSTPDLGRFGDYGRILQTHSHAYLTKDLAPPGLVTVNLKYRQIVDGVSPHY